MEEDQLLHFKWPFTEELKNWLQWMTTILKFSYESLQHHSSLYGELDFYNDVLKMEIVKKICDTTFKQL